MRALVLVSRRLMSYSRQAMKTLQPKRCVICWICSVCVVLNCLHWAGKAWANNQWLTEAQGGPNEALALAALADFGYSGIRLDGEGGKGNYVFINDDKGGVLQGAGGNDLILGGDGDDILSGGAGD